jgi:hypothetical protein
MSSKPVRRAIQLTWERRIQHIDRPMKRSSQRIIASALRKAKHRRSRGLPSRNVPHALAFMRVDVLRATKRSPKLSESEIDALKRRYEKELLRSRVLEHKHVALAKLRSQRISVTDTCINLWRRRLIWLSEAEG